MKRQRTGVERLDLRLLLLLGLVWPLPAMAKLIQVPGEVSDLQQAIDESNGGDVIELAAGTYPAPFGGFRINSIGKALTLRGAAGATVVLDGGATTDIFRLINGSLELGKPVTFENLTFRNGFSDSDGVAGGVTVLSAEATFRDCRFESNRANPNVNFHGSTGGGGTIVGDGSKAYFFDTVWTDNGSGNYGGGMAVGTGSVVHIHDSVFEQNYTNGPFHLPTAAGAGLHVTDSEVRVVNTRFEANEAGAVGGGMFVLGSWDAPQADAIVSNCTFIDNVIAPDGTVTTTFPPEGGGLHAEDHARARVYHSRFWNNRAFEGGGIGNYRAIVEVYDSFFQGNEGRGDASSQLGQGGTITILSNDIPDATTDFGAINRRSASLTLERSFVQGRFGATTEGAEVGGCLYVSGDGNRTYGINGVEAEGTLEQNRATVVIRDTAFYDCDAHANALGGSGAGGGILADLGDLVIEDSLFIDCDAKDGGGLATVNQSRVRVDRTTFAANTATEFGAGIFHQGSHLEVNDSTIVGNEITPGVSETCDQSFGAAIFSGPDVTRDLDVTGRVNQTVISENIGLPIFDDDRTDGPINDMRYDGNQIHTSSFGDSVYTNGVPGTICVDVATLNTEVTDRNDGSSTIRSSVDNTALATAPEVASLLAAPSVILAVNAQGDDPPPTTSAVVAAWGGAAAALNESPVAGHSAVQLETIPGTQTLTVGGLAPTVELGSGATPQTLFAADPTSVTGGGSTDLMWNIVAGSFLDADIDQGASLNTPDAMGSVAVIPLVPTTYTLSLVTEEGGAPASVTVNVTDGLLPEILEWSGSPILVAQSGASTLTYSTPLGTIVTLNGSALFPRPSGSFVVNPGGTTGFELAVENFWGQVSETVTVHVDDGANGLLAPPVITEPSNGASIGGGSTLSWQAVAGVNVGYAVWIWERGTGLEISTQNVDASTTSVTIDAPSGEYLVAVRACGQDYNAPNCGGFDSVEVVPEPSASMLAAAGLLSLTWLVRRKRTLASVS